jgi:hypothetical protein
MTQVLARISDGKRFLDGVELIVNDAATGTPLASGATATMSVGGPVGPGWVALTINPAPPVGRVRVVVRAEGADISSHEVALPPPGEVLQLALTLPQLVPAGMPGPDVAADPDAFACAACLLNGIDIRALARAHPKLAASTQRRLARHDPALLQRLVDGKLDARDIETEGGRLAQRLLGRPVGREELATLLANLLPSDDDNALPGPPGTWQTFRLGRVTVDYALTGDHALPDEAQAPPDAATDFAPPQGAAGTLVPGPHPALVQQVALVADRALEHFVAHCGMRDPGPQRIRICTLVAGRGVPYGETRPEWDHVRVNRINSIDDNRGTVPHEIFHRIQYAYNPSRDARAELHRAIREGGAVLAEDAFDVDANRYVHRARAYLDQPWRPMCLPGEAGPRHSYAAALFWRYVEEATDGGQRAAGAPRLPAMRAVLEATATRADDGTDRPEGGYSIDVLRRELIGGERFDHFVRLGDDRADAAVTDTLYGNWLVANAVIGDAERVGDRRFRYAEALAQAAAIRAHGPKRAIRATRLVDLGRPILVGDAPRLVRGRVLTFPPGPPVFPWSARYIRLGASGLVQVEVTSAGTPADPLVQLVRLGPAGQLEILRDEGPATRLVIAAAEADITYLIVATRALARPCTVTARLLADAPLPFITPWNCAAGTSFETDPRATPWRWLSPDIALAAPAGQAGGPVRLSIRVTNRGTAPADDCTVRLDCGLAQTMAAMCTLDAARDPAGSPIAAATGPIAVGGSATVEVDWQPPSAAPLADWIVRATATCGAHSASALSRLVPFTDDGWARPPTA